MQSTLCLALQEFPEKEFPQLYKKVETAPKMEAPVTPQEPPAPPQ